ncbi:MAG: hypothetical protein F4Z29_01520 [Gemmatimonadetes bacterium]|nr:hypothetical protein [Gemmatimonadota bacterium]
MADLYDETAGVPWEVFAGQILQSAVDVARQAGERDPLQADVPFESLEHESYYGRVITLWGGSLYFGMQHPAAVARLIEAELQEFNEKAPGWQAVGANIPAAHPWADVDAFYENCREFISTYEAEVQPLPPVPAKLREALADRLGN